MPTALLTKLQWFTLSMNHLIKEQEFAFHTEMLYFCSAFQGKKARLNDNSFPVEEPRFIGGEWLFADGERRYAVQESEDTLEPSSLFVKLQTEIPLDVPKNLWSCEKETPGQPFMFRLYRRFPACLGPKRHWWGNRNSVLTSRLPIQTGPWS